MRLVVEPNREVEWREFSKYPPGSIALDGYCIGRPRKSRCCTRLNINHHEEVDRLATRSSTAQAIMNVKMGMTEAFMVDGVYTATLYVNAGDQDVILSSYALMHPEHVDRKMFRELAYLADMLDTTMGLFPVKKRWHLLKRLLWITEPYTVARAEGRLSENLPPDELREAILTVIESCHRRIRATLFGRGKEREPDTRYEVIKDFGKWQCIREIGAEARLGVAQSGVMAFVAPVGEVTENGPNRFVFHRRSEFIGWFPTPKMYRRLNEAEGRGPDVKIWGGAITGGGCLREEPSNQSLDSVLGIIEECVNEECAEDCE